MKYKKKILVPNQLFSLIIVLFISLSTWDWISLLLKLLYLHAKLQSPSVILIGTPFYCMAFQKMNFFLKRRWFAKKKKKIASLMKEKNRLIIKGTIGKILSLPDSTCSSRRKSVLVHIEQCNWSWIFPAPGQFPNHIHMFWYINIDFDNSISVEVFQKVLVLFQGGMKTNVIVSMEWNCSNCDTKHNTC